MRLCSWAMALIAINAWYAEIPTPSRMYIVSAAFSDFGALFYYRVVDVRTDGPDIAIHLRRIVRLRLERTTSDDMIRFNGDSRSVEITPFRRPLRTCRGSMP